MKQFLLYVTQLKQYRTNVILHFVCYIFTALFTIISIPAIIPLFEMLFQQEYKVVEKPLNVNGISGMIDQLKYHFSSWIAGQDKSTAVMWICVGIAAVFFFKNVFRYFAIYFMTPVRASLVRDTRSKLFAKMIDLPMSYFSDERKGDLIARMTADVHEVEWTLLSTLESWVKDPLIIIGSISFMLYTSPSLTLFVVLLLIGTSFVIGGISRTLKKKSLNAQEEFGDLISLQEESLGGLRVVKVFGAESYIKDRFNAILDKYRKLLIDINRRRELAPPMSEFLGIVIVCILLAYGASLVFSSQIQASTFLAFLYAFFNVIEPSKGISASYFNVQKGVAALDRINEVLNMKVNIYDKPNAISKVSFDHQIEFKGVSFQYANSNVKVLDDIHFSLKKGEKIAIVGSSGSGKSTLVDLLARFYDVSKGSITIDGVDIKDIKISDLRSLMGMVTQEPILFNDSIRRNIEFGSKTYSDEMIWTILDTAYASDFVREGNRGLDYNIGDRGSKLSGGQRQRLTLARAILRNPAILILDEATSALDSASEMIVQEAMEHVLENRTAIIIAHRLSTIKKVDKIIVIQDGRIVEQGTHDELINKQGEYFNFVSLQSINHYNVILFMNKIYLFFILFSFSVQAQNTVTNRVLPVVGDSFAYAIDTFIENTSMSPGGVNQTWDFTNVQSNGRRSEVYRDVNTSTGASDFPTANAYIRQGQREVFLKISSDKVEELGYNLKLGGPFPVGGTSAYPKPAVILKTPLNFLDASSYKTEAVITLPADFIPDSLLMGLKVDSIRIKTTTTVNVLVDGSGTLNLPAKSWNVLREKLTTSTKTTIEAKIFVWIDVTQLIGGQLGDFVQNTNTISYGFRSNDAKGYMALVAVDSTDKITQIQYKPNDLGVKTKDINDVNHQIQILTNPVNNILNLKTNEIRKGSYSLFLYNEAGQLVKSTIKELNSNQSIQFPVHELSEGIYNIIIVDPSKRIITNERFIKN